jgi:hypothetical protein
MLVVFAVLFLLAKGQSCYDVQVDWQTVVQTSKVWVDPHFLFTNQTITTLQVVANPILNPKTSPVAKRAWESLAALNADLVRYVPWYTFFT